MAYIKTNWVNGQTPAINADNLNKIETGIKGAHDGIDNILGTIAPIGTILTTNGINASIASGTTQVAISTEWELPAGTWMVMASARFTSLGGHRCHGHLRFNGEMQSASYVTIGSEAAAAVELVGVHSSESAFNVQIWGWQNKGSAMANVDWYMTAVRIK